MAPTLEQVRSYHDIIGTKCNSAHATYTALDGLIAIYCWLYHGYVRVFDDGCVVVTLDGYGLSIDYHSTC